MKDKNKGTIWKTPTGITMTSTKEDYNTAEAKGYKRFLSQQEFYKTMKEQTTTIRITPTEDKDLRILKAKTGEKNKSRVIRKLIDHYLKSVSES